MPKPIVVLSINASWNVVNFRLNLVRALQGAGYRVVVLAPTDAHSAALTAAGVEHQPIAMQPRGLSPIGDALLFLRYLAVLRRLRPSVYLGYTIKPNIWGALAARGLRIPVIANIAGLGETFVGNGWLNRLVRFLYRRGLAEARTVFFQNPDDRALFLQTDIVDPAVARLLPGSGIDLVRFAPSTAQRAAGPVRFLLVSRLLTAKGIAEYAAASAMLRERGIDVQCDLLGLPQQGRGAVSEAMLAEWTAAGLIRFLGGSDDVRPFLADADAVVLPTYYPEGTPRALLEAAAAGKPLIASDVPGCREIVRDGVNGYLCPPRDVTALADAMARFAALPDAQRAAFGAASRDIAEREYDDRIVSAAYLDEITQALGR